MTKGFYDIAQVPGAAEHFAAAGVSVRVVCASAESGLDFGVGAGTRTGRAAQRRAYHALGVELDCVQPIGGALLLAAPRPVLDPSKLPDDELVQEGKGPGYLGDSSNPACLGMTMQGVNIATVATCHTFVDSPATWWAYVCTRAGKPFVITGVLMCSWREAPRKLVHRLMDLIRTQVRDAKLKFNQNNLWVWMSPGGRNYGVGEDGIKQGFSIGTADRQMLLHANSDFDEFISDGAGTSDELPHGLDVVGLTMHQLFDAGLPETHLGGLYEDTVTTRTADGSGYRWGSAQRDGEAFVSSILAGTVRVLR